MNCLMRSKNQKWWPRWQYMRRIEGKSMLKTLPEYFKGDYIAFGVVKTVIATTFCEGDSSGDVFPV